MTGTPVAHKPGVRTHLTVNVRDNVTTLLDALTDRTELGGGMAIAAGIPFGHKAAISEIAKGDPVIKYGVVIGHATQHIAQGDHVHVHNLA